MDAPKNASAAMSNWGIYFQPRQSLTGARYAKKTSRNSVGGGGGTQISRSFSLQTGLPHFYARMRN
jgi:hypothetical protein